jgi:hypothetical protein
MKVTSGVGDQTVAPSLGSAASIDSIYVSTIARIVAFASAGAFDSEPCVTNEGSTTSKQNPAIQTANIAFRVIALFSA